MRIPCAPSLALACLAVSLGSSPVAAQWVATHGPAAAQTNAFA